MTSALVESTRRGFKRHWKTIRRAATLVFFTVVATLLIRHAGTIKWQEVIDALVAYQPAVLLLAGVLAFSALFLYSTFDLFGRAYIYRSDGSPGDRRKLRKRQVFLVTFISYVFNLNLGALVGGFAFRYRLYSRLGLTNKEIATVVGLSVATNWLGYCLLGGLVFALGGVTVPTGWNIGDASLRVVGVAILAVPVIYLALCGTLAGRSWDIRETQVTIPPLRIALLQLLVSCAHWLTIASVIFVLLHRQVEFSMVLGVLLLSGVAGAVTHIPGALGVLEAVFVMLLGNQVGRADLLAALLAYRALFYLLPLTVATTIYVGMEIRFRRQPE